MKPFPNSRRKCRHDNLRGVYGDEIIQAGYKRSRCTDCGKWFEDLPPEWHQPFRTRDYHGNVYYVNIKGNLPIDTTGTPATVNAIPNK